MADLSFTPDRTAYIRNHAWMAALAMAAAMGILWVMGNAYVWTGAVAGLAAIALRGGYLASEELAVVWKIDDGALVGPGDQRIALANIDAVRTMGSFVQVITRDGHKYLIKYQGEPAKTKAAIERACL